MYPHPAHFKKTKNKVPFLYINNRQTEREFWKTIPFMIASKNKIT
jgi:hypothetical protein